MDARNRDLLRAMAVSLHQRLHRLETLGALWEVTPFTGEHGPEHGRYIVKSRDGPDEEHDWYVSDSDRFMENRSVVSWKDHYASLYLQGASRAQRPMFREGPPAYLRRVRDGTEFLLRRTPYIHRGYNFTDTLPSEPATVTTKPALHHAADLVFTPMRAAGETSPAHNKWVVVTGSSDVADPYLRSNLMTRFKIHPPKFETHSQTALERETLKYYLVRDLMIFRAMRADNYEIYPDDGHVYVDMIVIDTPRLQKNTQRSPAQQRALADNIATHLLTYMPLVYEGLVIPITDCLENLGCDHLTLVNSIQALMGAATPTTTWHTPQIVFVVDPAHHAELEALGIQPLINTHRPS